jgi:hypothetical protein
VTARLPRRAGQGQVEVTQYFLDMLTLTIEGPIYQHRLHSFSSILQSAPKQEDPTTDNTIHRTYKHSKVAVFFANAMRSTLLVGPFNGKGLSLMHFSSMASGSLQQLVHRAVHSGKVRPGFEEHLQKL